MSVNEQKKKKTSIDSQYHNSNIHGHLSNDSKLYSEECKRFVNENND